MGLGVDAIDELELLCQQAAMEWSHKIFFMGQLTFEGKPSGRDFLHNQTSFAMQRRLLFDGFETVILPIRLRLDEQQPLS